MSKPTKVPGIPKPPASVDRNTASLLTNLIEAVEIRLGRRGDPKDRAITLRELIESGLAKDFKASPWDPNNPNSGNMGFGPNDVIDTDIPPAPLNFQANAAYSQVNLSWDYPNYGNHSYAEIYGHDSDTIGDAQIIGASTGRGYADPIGSGASRYYWIRFVSQSNIVGPFNSGTGTLATTAADVDHLLGVLTDAITESELATDLQTEIDKISGDIDLPDSVAARIAAEAAARALAVSAEATARATAISAEATARVTALSDEAAARATAITGEATARATALDDEATARATAIASSANALQAQLNDLTGIAAWDSTESYSIDDKVRHDDKLWSADAANSDSEPTYSDGASTNSDWELTGDYTSLASVTADNSAAITAINNVSTDSSSAAAVAIKALNGEVFAADGTSLLATGSALTGLTTDVRGIYTAADGDDPASGLLASAQASITSLNGEVFAADGSSLLATGSALSGLTTDVRSIYTEADGDTPASGILTSVQSDVTTLNGEVFAEDGSSLLATGSAVTGLTTAVSNIYTPVDGDTPASGILASVQSDVTDLNGEVFAADGTSLLATGSALTGLTTDVRDIYTEADGDTPASGVLASVQSDVTDLNGEVFAADGTSLLATGSALTGLTTNVRDIYTEADGDTPASGVLASVQSDVTDLNGEVFAADGTSLLATGSALSGLTTDVRSIYTEADGDTPASGILTSVQADVTDLNGEVFAADGTSLLATGSALSGLTTDVRDIYTEADGDTPASGVLASVQADVTDLNGEVFAADGTSLLATGSALSGLTTDVRDIYTEADGDTPASGILSSVQSDVSDLNGEVFAADGTSLLATGSAVSGLTTDVRDIYTEADGDNPASGILSSVQADVSDLNGAVFNADGDVVLATGSALSGLTTDVRDIYTEADGDTPASGVLASVQSDVTDLNGAVFNTDGDVVLASGSSVSTLTSDVEAIYDADGSEDGSPSGLLASAQASITSLQGAVFDGDGDVKLASGSAVSTLTSDVEAIYDADGGEDGSPSGLLASSQSAITALQGAVFDEDDGVKLAEASAVETLETEVYGDGSAGASRIDGLYTALFDEDGDLFASASALETLDSAVTGDGGIASKVSNIAAAMYTDSDTTGTSLFATSANLDTVTAQVFPDGLTETSRIAQLSSALYTDGDPEEGVKLASADFVSNINTAVFGDGTTQTAAANKIDTLQVVVEGADGNGGIKNAIETTQEIVGDSTSGLQAQYTVKIDSNGHVAGFGLANTTTASGSNTSEFYVNADRFAITPDLTSAAPAFVVGNSYSAGDFVTHNNKVWMFKLVNSSTNQPASNYPVNYSSLQPGGSSGSAALLWEQAGHSPFVIQANNVAPTFDTDGNLLTPFIPRGVYMNTARIKHADITHTKIGSVNADTISTGTLNVTDLIETNAIEASKLSIDNNVLAENSSGELILKTVSTNDGSGVKYENLSFDAVGVIAQMLQSGNLTMANTTYPSAYFYQSLPYSEYTFSGPYGSTTTTTLPELLTLNIPASQLKESGYYFIDFGAQPFGSISSSSSTSASMVVLDVWRKLPSASTYTISTARIGVETLNGSLPLTFRTGNAEVYISKSYDYQLKLHGLIKGFNDSPSSNTKGIYGGFVRVFKIHKST